MLFRSAAITTVLFGAALAGLILMGDVILADVIDDDELRSGQRREGMYYGMAGFITTLSSALTSQTFGAVTRASGYDPTLTVQPDAVADGFGGTGVAAGTAAGAGAVVRGGCQGTATCAAPDAATERTSCDIQSVRVCPTSSLTSPCST